MRNFSYEKLMIFQNDYFKNLCIRNLSVIVGLLPLVPDKLSEPDDIP